MTKLTEIPIQELLNKIAIIKGVRAFDLDSHLGEFKLAFELPDKSELVAIINVHQDRSFFDVEKTPEVTPMAYLLVDEMLGEYDLQPIAPSRSKIAGSLSGSGLGPYSDAY